MRTPNSATVRPFPLLGVAYATCHCRWAFAACLAAVSQALAAEQAPVQAIDSSPSPWSAHVQATWIDQAHPSFTSPYEGANSLAGESQTERTFSFSLFLGYRLLAGTEVY